MIEIRIVSTGETGTVIGDKVDGQYLVEFADGTTRAVSGAERVQVIPPGWSLIPPGSGEDDHG